MANEIVQQIIEVFRRRGSEAYGSESVTQLQHAIQSAELAKRENAPTFMLAAALLHDIGHILGDEALPVHESENYDDKHEFRAYAWLRTHFGKRIADPVRLHVAAKRYLCTVDESYSATLSPTSLKSFHDQGGVMNLEEQTAFEQEEFFQEAVQLRRWDDAAKDPSIPMPAIEEYVETLREVLVT